MDKNKENNFFEILRVSRRLEEIFKPMPILTWQNKIINIINPERLKLLRNFAEVNKTLAAGFEWSKNLQRTTESIQKAYEILETAQKELAERNIDIEIITELELSELFQLCSLSGKLGLSFADIVEDSLKLFDCVSYEKAVTYLELINRRKNQVIKNEVESFTIDNNFPKNLKCFKESIGAYIKIKLVEYEKGEIKLKNEEKNLLRALKKNRYISNKELTKTLGYSERGVEELCAKIRHKFEMDSIDEKTVKRQALVELAKYIEL